MSNDFIGIRKFCDLCVYSAIKNNNIICNNKTSSFDGMVVNTVLCAPCITPRDLEGKKEIETASFY